MFGFGPMEMAIVALLIVLLFPPHELPKIARTVARAYGSFRRTTDDLRRAVMLDDELRKPLDEIRNAYDEARFDLKRAHDSLRSEMQSTSRAAQSALSEVSVKTNPPAQPVTAANALTPALDKTAPSSASASTASTSVPRIVPAAGTLARGVVPPDEDESEPRAAVGEPISRSSAGAEATAATGAALVHEKTNEHG